MKPLDDNVGGDKEYEKNVGENRVREIAREEAATISRAPINKALGELSYYFTKPRFWFGAAGGLLLGFSLVWMMYVALLGLSRLIEPTPDNGDCLLVGKIDQSKGETSMVSLTLQGCKLVERNMEKAEGGTINEQ